MSSARAHLAITGQARRVVRGPVVVALVVLGVVLALPARAQLPPATPAHRAPRLEFHQGPGECLPEVEFRREVAIAGDGVDRFDAAGEDVVRVRFERTLRGYRGTIQFVTTTGDARPDKVLEHASCEVLGRWLGVAAYYYLPEREPEPQPSAPVACEVPHAFVPPPSPPQRFEEYIPPTPSLWEQLGLMDLTIGLSAYALMTAGLTANVGPGFGIGADVRGEIFSLGVEFRGVLPTVVYAEAPLDPKLPLNGFGYFDLSQWTGLLVPCARYKYFLGCGVAQGGVAVLQADTQTTRPVLSFGPRLGFDVPFAERFSVFGFGEALFAAVLPGVDDSIHNVTWTQSVVSGFFSAGLSVNFK